MDEHGSIPLPAKNVSKDTEASNIHCLPSTFQGTEGTEHQEDSQDLCLCGIYIRVMEKDREKAITKQDMYEL